MDTWKNLTDRQTNRQTDEQMDELTNGQLPNLYKDVSADSNIICFMVAPGPTIIYDQEIWKFGILKIFLKTALLQQCQFINITLVILVHIIWKKNIIVSKYTYIFNIFKIYRLCIAMCLKKIIQKVDEKEDFDNLMNKLDIDDPDIKFSCFKWFLFWQFRFSLHLDNWYTSFLLFKFVTLFAYVKSYKSINIFWKT